MPLHDTSSSAQQLQKLLRVSEPLAYKLWDEIVPVINVENLLGETIHQQWVEAGPDDCYNAPLAISVPQNEVWYVHRIGGIVQLPLQAPPLWVRGLFIFMSAPFDGWEYQVPMSDPVSLDTTGTTRNSTWGGPHCDFTPTPLRAEPGTTFNLSYQATNAIALPCDLWLLIEREAA